MEPNKKPTIPVADINVSQFLEMFCTMNDMIRRIDESQKMSLELITHAVAAMANADQSMYEALASVPKEDLPEKLSEFLGKYKDGTFEPNPHQLGSDNTANAGGAADNGGADGAAGADAGNGGSGDGATDDTAYPLLDANIKTMQDMQDFLGKLAVILLEREDKVASASLDEIFNNITREYKVDKISALPEFMVGKIVPLFSADLEASDANFTKTRTLML